MGKLSRDKGHRWERQVARDLRDIWPEGRIRRGQQSRDGADCSDVITPLLWVECKCGKRPKPHAALRQATDAAAAGGRYDLIPVAVIKPDRESPYVCMAWEDFLHLLKGDLL